MALECKQMIGHNDFEWHAAQYHKHVRAYRLYPTHHCAGSCAFEILMKDGVRVLYAGDHTDQDLEEIGLSGLVHYAYLDGTMSADPSLWMPSHKETRRALSWVMNRFPDLRTICMLTTGLEVLFKPKRGYRVDPLLGKRCKHALLDQWGAPDPTHGTLKILSTHHQHATPKPVIYLTCRWFTCRRKALQERRTMVCRDKEGNIRVFVSYHASHYGNSGFRARKQVLQCRESASECLFDANDKDYEVLFSLMH